MEVIHSAYDHYTTLTVPTRQEKQHFRLHVVYFINCLIHENYLDWLKNQVKMVDTYTNHVHVVATVREHLKDVFVQQCRDLFPFAEVTLNFTNQHEYPGILKVWELAQTHREPTDLILYFHSKGITRYQNCLDEPNPLWEVPVKELQKVYDVFSTFPTVDKVGYQAGGNGWFWCNYWYARGSYLCQVERPLLTARRHYYEDWLGRKSGSDDLLPDVERPFSFYPNTLANCYGFFTDKVAFGNIGSYYCPGHNQMFLT